MGAFNINITGVGGHGCERKAKPGEKLFGRCGRYACPDCMTYEFVQQLRQRGMLQEGQTAEGQEVQHAPSCNASSEEGCTCPAVPLGAEVYTSDGKTYWRTKQSATFTHWPNSPSRVVDDLLKNERVSGSF